MSRDRSLLGSRWFAPLTLAGFALVASSCAKEAEVEKPAVPAAKEISKAAESQVGEQKRDANKSQKTGEIARDGSNLAHAAGKQVADANRVDADKPAAAAANAAKKASAEKVRIAGGNLTFRIQ